MKMKFIVPGKPQGKARARTFYNPKLGRMSSFTPGNTVLYENLVKTMYIEQVNAIFPAKTPLKVEIDAYMTPPKSVSKKAMSEMLQGKVRPTKKPDIDNIVKAILDALNGLAYADDTQVVEVIATKKIRSFR